MLIAYHSKETALRGSPRTTRFILEPSAAVLVLADAGVSGSIRPLRIFLSSGIGPTSMHKGLFRQAPPVGSNILREKVLFIAVSMLLVTIFIQFERMTPTRGEGRQHVVRGSAEDRQR